MRVLVVDDERNIREAISRLLELDGIESRTASDGAEAAEILKTEGFDAVVTDLKMPVMGGQQLLERIRDEGLRCPVIMISALGEIGDAVKALKTGAVDYLIKPFDPDELIHKNQGSRDDQEDGGPDRGRRADGFAGSPFRRGRHRRARAQARHREDRPRRYDGPHHRVRAARARKWWRGRYTPCRPGRRSPL